MSLQSDLAARTRIVNDTVAEVQRLLREGATIIQGILDGQPTEYERWSLTRIEAAINDALRQIGSDAARVTIDGISAVASGGTLIVDNAIRAQGWGTLPPVIDSPLLAAMRTFTAHKIAGITVATADRINTQVGLVMIGAIDRYDARRAIADALGATMKRAQTILYHESARVYSTANQQRLDQAAAEIPGLKKRWIRSRKRIHPRINHAVIHGQTVPVDQPFRLKDQDGKDITMMHPHDPRAPISETIHCGCVSVPIVPGMDVPEPDNTPSAPDDLERGKPIRELLDGDDTDQTLAQRAFPKLDAAARNYVLKNGVKSGHEYLYAYDAANGTIAAQHTSHLPSEVRFTAALSKLCEDPNCRLVIHHNHPRSSSLSFPDLNLLRSPGVQEVIAHGHDTASFFARAGAHIDDVATARQYTPSALASAMAGHPPPVGLQMDNWYAHLVNQALGDLGVIDYRAVLDSARQASYNRHQEYLSGLRARIAAAFSDEIARLQEIRHVKP